MIFCIHSIWQKVQDTCFIPKRKNKNAEIEKYKALVDQISQQKTEVSIPIIEPTYMNKNVTELDLNPSSLGQNQNSLGQNQISLGHNSLETDLNHFLDSILLENNIDIIPPIL